MAVIEDFYTPRNKKEICCLFTDGVICDSWGTSASSCDRCGHNPDVNEMRKAAIKMGELKFLRCNVRDYNKVMNDLNKKKK